MSTPEYSQGLTQFKVLQTRLISGSKLAVGVCVGTNGVSVSLY